MNNPEIDKDGTKRWLNKEGKYYRVDGPAVEWADGSKQWWVNYFDITDEALIWYKEQGLDVNTLLTTDQQILFKLKFG